MKKFNNDNWKNDMRLKFDYNYMMKEHIGIANGFIDSDIEDCMPIYEKAFETVKANRGTGMLGWTELPYNQSEIVKEIENYSKHVREKYEYFVVLGIGGSALGPIAVFQALKHLHYNDLPRQKRGGPKFYVEDNVDPERMDSLFDVIEPDKTLFNVVSKSGATSETMAQYLIIFDYIKKRLGKNVADHIVVTTSQNSGNLIKLAKEEGYYSFYIPDSVGGRFSELCPVGLLPASVIGVDIAEMLEGAKYMDEVCMTSNIKTNPALAFAVVQYLSMKEGKNVSVMMPYADSLKYMSDWYAQLWAESLGKIDKNGISHGQTPVKALGVTDQHSQVQLYVEGPSDKVVTFIKVENFRSKVKIPGGLEQFPDVAFLSGHTLNELIDTELFSTAYALATRGKPNNMIIFPEVNAFTLGEFMFMLELATAYAGEMLGINTYDQPGVEAGKNATYAMFGKKGYDEKRKELDKAPKLKNEYIS